MPAYRSEKEGLIRNAVVERLREARPEARIIHEINACGFGNRIDVLAIDEAEIIAVEVKSEKDKLTRLPAQIKAMNGVAHHAVSAFHEKFLIEYTTNMQQAHVKRGDQFIARDAPNESHGSIGWVYPKRRRLIMSQGIDFLEHWRLPDAVPQVPLPFSAIHILWRDELAELCETCRVTVPRRADMQLMVNALRWGATGRALTRGICAALRRRECVEADPPKPILEPQP